MRRHCAHYHYEDRRTKAFAANDEAAHGRKEDLSRKKKMSDAEYVDEGGNKQMRTADDEGDEDEGRLSLLGDLVPE